MLKPDGRAADPVTVAPAAPKYDPKPIEALAVRLERKAEALALGGTAAGALLGALVGAIPLTPLDSIWAIPAMFGVATLLLGGLVGALFGYVIGAGRALAYRARAQQLLCQVRTERQTALASQLLVKLASRPAAVAPPPAPAPAPEPDAVRPPAPLRQVVEPLAAPPLSGRP